MIIGGVLYVHDIMDKKFLAADKRIIKGLCQRYGDSSMQNTTLVTTNWGPPMPEGSSNREKALNGHWDSVIRKGAMMHRFDNDLVSAQAIIDSLLERIVKHRKEWPNDSSVGKKVTSVRTMFQGGCVVQ